MMEPVCFPVQQRQLTAKEKNEFLSSACQDCCRERCLLTKVDNIDAAIKLVEHCRGQIAGYDQKQVYKHIYGIVKESCVELLPTGIWKHNFVIGKR